MYENIFTVDNEVILYIYIYIYDIYNINAKCYYFESW